jgi:hypothetical protein
MKLVLILKGFDMGDRALVILKDGTDYSPVMYLHWHAPQVQNYVNRLKEVMVGREGDIQYGFARLVGIAHNDIQGNLSLGCWSLPEDFSETDEAMLKKMSHGDGGIYVVDLKDYSITTYAGYGLEHQNERDGGEADRIAVRAIVGEKKKAA